MISSAHAHFLPLSSIVFGRLVQDPKRPHEDFLDPPSAELEIVTHHLTNPEPSIPHSIFSDTSEPPKITVHNLQDPLSCFTDACAYPTTRAWLEQSFNNRRDAHLIIGLHTVIAAGGETPAHFPAGHEEQVLAIRYRKVEFNWLSKSTVLGANTQWRTDWDWRGLECEEDEDDVLEVSLGDEGIEIAGGGGEMDRLGEGCLPLADMDEDSMCEEYEGHVQGVQGSWTTGKREWSEVGGDGGEESKRLRM